MDPMRDILVLAEDDFGDVIHILMIVAFVVMVVIGTLLGKAKERAQRRKAEEIERQRALRGRQAEAPAQPARQPPAAEQGGAAGPRQIEEDVQAVIGRLFGIAPQAQAPAPPAPPRRPPPPPRRPAQRRARKPAPSAKRGRSPGGLAAEPERTAERRVATAGLKIALAGRDEARRGIVYAEILGLPKALRTNLEPWER
jgi:hypothetical protein